MRLKVFIVLVVTLAIFISNMGFAQPYASNVTNNIAYYVPKPGSPIILNEAEQSWKDFFFKVRVWWSDLSGDVKASSASESVDLVDDMGLGDTETNLDIVFEKRVNKRGWAGLRYTAIRHSSTVTLDRDITLPSEVDASSTVTFNKGTTVDTYLKYNAVELYYKYKIVKNWERSGLYLLGGIRFNDAEASATSSSSKGLYSINIPTFYLGLNGYYKLSDNLGGYLDIKGFSSANSDKTGALFEYEVGLEFNLSDNMAIDLGYRHAEYDLTDSADNDADFTLEGLLGGLMVKF